MSTDITQIISSRIIECHTETASYDAWLRQLRSPNFVLTGGGSLLAFLGGAAIVANTFDKSYAGYMALIGGALTGLHKWLDCDSHQSECRRLASLFESLDNASV